MVFLICLVSKQMNLDFYLNKCLVKRSVETYDSIGKAKCFSCEMVFVDGNNQVICSFCERMICSECCLICFFCKLMFCRLCAVKSYQDNHIENIACCLSCGQK